LIVYRLVCSSGHEFEGWFTNSAMFDEQAAKHALDCPVCGDTDVKKAIMAPAIGKAAEQVTAVSAQNEQPDQRKIRQFMAGYRKFIEANAEYVGPSFPEEARKIHYGEADERHIYGESTLREARELVEEGIEIAPLPPDPDELN
jgi:hypothetical protein